MISCIIKITSVTEANNYIYITYTIWGDRGVLTFINLLTSSASSVRINFFLILTILIVFPYIPTKETA